MKLQEKTSLKIKIWTTKYGGLSKTIEAQIENLVAQYEKQNFVQKVNQSIIDGTVLSREYQGKTYTITVLAKGYLYENKVYRSLSTVANKITGTHCNGKKFFGVK